MGKKKTAQEKTNRKEPRTENGALWFAIVHLNTCEKENSRTVSIIEIAILRICDG